MFIIDSAKGEAKWVAKVDCPKWIFLTGKHINLLPKCEATWVRGVGCAVLILISFSAATNYLFIIGIVTSFILIKFLAETFALVEKFYGWSQYPFPIILLRKLLSVPLMVVALPTIIATLNILDYQITLVALLITTIYTLLAISWLIVVSIASRK